MSAAVNPRRIGHCPGCPWWPVPKGSLRAEVQNVVDDVFERLRRVDVVVNNAGYGLYAAIEEPTHQQIRSVLDVNLMGSIDVIRATLPHLRAQGAGRRRARWP